MKFILLTFLLVISAFKADAQTIWSIEFGNKEQYNQWVESVDFDGSVYKEMGDIEFWGNAIYKNDSLQMKIKYPTKEQFDIAFILLVNEFGEPSIFSDKDLKAEREKEELKGDYKKKEEYGKVDERTVEAIIQDGDLTMERRWILVDYELNLLWDKYGILFSCIYKN